MQSTFLYLFCNPHTLLTRPRYAHPICQVLLSTSSAHTHLANPSDTCFPCAECSYAYRLHHTGLANFVRRPGVIECTALAIFVVSVLSTGFVVKWTRIGWALDGGAEESTLLDVEGASLGWSYVLSGCVGVGIIGFSTLVILLPMRGFGFIGYHPNLFRGSVTCSLASPCYSFM